MSGRRYFDDISIAAASAVAISGGAVTVTQANHSVTAEGGAADALDTINKATLRDGDFVVLRLDGANRVTLTNAGNIRTPGGKDYTLAVAGDTAYLRYDGTNWELVGWKATLDSPVRSRFNQIADSSVVTNPAAPEAFDVSYTELNRALLAGTKVKIRAKIRKTGQGGADQSTYTLRIGGVTIIAFQQTAAATALVLIEATVAIRTVGAGGTFEALAQVSQSPLAGGAIAASAQQQVHDGAVDTTTDTVIDIQVTRSVDDPGNTHVLEMFTVEHV